MLPCHLFSVLPMVRLILWVVAHCPSGIESVTLCAIVLTSLKHVYFYFACNINGLQGRFCCLLWLRFAHQGVCKGGLSRTCARFFWSGLCHPMHLTYWGVGYYLPLGRFPLSTDRSVGFHYLPTSRFPALLWWPAPRARSCCLDCSIC